MKNTHEKFRKLIYNGKPYRFDYISFSDMLAEKASVLKEKKRRISQSEWMNRIADMLDISFEAVKNWKRGYNGPKDIDSVIKCAEVLSVDVLSLLKPLDENQECKIMSEKEISIIENIFCECIKLIYGFSDRFEEYNNDPDNNRRVHTKAKNDFLLSAQKMHLAIDESALFISDSVRYRLHRLLNDVSESCKTVPERWWEIEDSLEDYIDIRELTLFYYGAHDRKTMLDNICYISSEQEIAEKMNYSYTDIPENYYDNVDLDGVPFDENDNQISLERFGITDDTEFEINPQILFKDMMTRLLRDVFVHDFPELQSVFNGV